MEENNDRFLKLTKDTTGIYLGHLEEDERNVVLLREADRQRAKSELKSRIEKNGRDLDDLVKEIGKINEESKREIDMYQEAHSQAAAEKDAEKDVEKDA